MNEYVNKMHFNDSFLVPKQPTFGIFIRFFYDILIYFASGAMVKSLKLYNREFTFNIEHTQKVKVLNRYCVDIKVNFNHMCVYASMNTFVGKKFSLNVM